MAYKEVSGNIFNTKAMAVVNTVNCVGAMGKGIALDFKLRYPEMFKEYQRICFQHLLKPGQILPYKKSSPIILNFAIKDDWKEPSKIEWIEETLKKFVDNYKKLGITSVAFPWMGAMNGGLPIEVIKELTRKYLSSLDDIDIEVYDFDPNVPCELYRSLQEIVFSEKFKLSELEVLSNIKSRYWIKIIDAVNDPNTKSINNLRHYIVNGKRIIGKTNIERLFVFLTMYKDEKLPIIKDLF
ncbi:macro domain-containing protein [Parabacteroides johnsonii]|mgnify:FL=1|jgi:O-acetyl-ADP-ribose deacetylase (regulator of RNase III)|uniref:macro domain-containing protein n=1 Tax=Parabacteroides johnsonii TaxID=387661 RepID=UPI00249572C8|nr:macro domain-containing protein [Parabacteroides johnsonii]